MKTITFYSYKGGVGRSLALANIATRLSEFGKKVCLLDFDLEAPGLHYKFSSLLETQKIEIKQGIIDYIHKFSNEGREPDRIIDYSYSFLNFSLSATTSEPTILIPAGNTNSSDYWKNLSSIDWNDLLFDNTAGLVFLLNLKKKIKNELSPDYLLIDSRTGISHISGISLSLLADDVVVIASNNRENLDGAKKIIKSISDPANNILGNKPKVTFVLSRIPFTDKPEERAKEQNLLSKVEREFGHLITEVNIIHSDRELEENEQIKIGYEKDGIDPQVSRDYLNLFERLTFDDFTDEQKTNFKNIKEAERFYKKAVLESSFPQRLEFINKAIDLNRSNKEYLLFRASIQAAPQVIEDCDAVLALDTSNIRAYEMKGEALLKQNKFMESKQAFESILRFDENYIGAKLGLAKIYLNEGDYGKALTAYNQIIKLDEENVIAYTGRANVKILTNNFFSALEDVYTALSLNSGCVEAFAALAEINIQLNNIKEFYLNLELALKLDSKWMESFLNEKKIKRRLSDDKRFNKIIEKYSLHLNEIE
jgi:MinD-like ATPase involved in chromosome partitioning or flagellar assembly/thioredoxin-like negative regulator of GroEL